MEDSVTYQAVIEKGRLEGRPEETRATLLRQGTANLRAPSETTRQRIESITDLEQLEQWLMRTAALRLLLARPGGRRRTRLQVVP